MSGKIPSAFQSLESMTYFLRNLSSNNLQCSIPIELSRIGNLDTLFCMRMTENLSEKYIIGYGVFSTVYKCILKNFKPVAIKKLHSYLQCLKEFETELETVGSIKHINLVYLQGYSLSLQSKVVAPRIVTSGGKAFGAEKIEAVAHSLIASVEKTSISFMRTTFYEIMRKQKVQPIGFLPWATFAGTIGTCTCFLLYGDGSVLLSLFL
ncbi:hypothetical protein VNO78_29031 [Psophocarpus tetragonolobus]|uniref:Serine-threonine/tyrosine-protein kinase catalytic domain-containing protein n=1 Tax=Psophocarpus tetragonolobus TaxID=3891 RepID=A0AAN9X0A8_PSOTE